MSSVQLAGRDAEVAELHSLADHLAEGKPRVALVAGEAGFGKSRLISTVADILRPAGVEVLVGHCLDLGPGGPPYAAVTEALRSAGEDVAYGALDALTGTADVGRAQLFEVVRGTFAALAGRRPLILVVEDMHWADRATQHLLTYLLGTADEGRWALVGSYRSEEVRRRRVLRDLLSTLERDPVVRINVEALPATGVAEQIEGITGERPTADYAAAMQRRTGGSPLLVEELVAAERAGVLGVPDHLRDTLAARVETLQADTQELVAAASACGERCDEQLLQAVLGWEAERVEEALSRCVLSGVLVVAGDGYRFRHELLREVVHGELLPGRRREFHAEVASALSASGNAAPARLAYHWDEAGDAESAARAALAAAANAMRAQAPAAAHAQLERVNALWDELSDELREQAGGRASLLENAAFAASVGGALGRGVELAEQAVAVTSVPADAAARWERVGRHRWINGDGNGSQAAYERAVEMLPADAPAGVRARVFSGYTWFLDMRFQYSTAVEVGRAAMDAADRSGDEMERCRAMVAWAGAQPDPVEAETAAKIARDHVIARGSTEQLGQAQIALDGALRRQGRVRERADALLAGLEDIPEYEYANRSYLQVYRLDSLVHLGRWDEADEVVGDLMSRSTEGMLGFYATAPRTWLAAVRGQADQARQLADEVAAFAAGIPQQPYPAIVSALGEAENALWQSEPATAAQAAGRALELASVDPPTAAAAVATGVRSWADVAARARRAGDAERVAQAKAEAERLFQSRPEPAGEPLIRFGVLAEAELSRLRGRSDPERWRACVTAWDAAEDPYRAAYCGWRLAEALLVDRSGRAEAKQVLGEARKVAGELGAEPLSDAIEDLELRSRLRRRGSESASSPAAALDLTSREQEIITWVTAGRTNREIADALWLSPRTVATHVSRVMRKLGVSTRTEVADAAHRLRLVSNE